MPDAVPNPDRQDTFAEDLRKAAEGDGEMRRRLWGEHYETLHECAKQWFARHWHRRGADHRVSLGATHIVHAAFERMHDRTAALAHGRQYFFRAFYTECMRIVIDHYRRTRDDKGRGDQKRVEFHSQFLADNRAQIDLGELHAILGELGDRDARLGQVAMLRVLETRPTEGGGTRGLTNAEVAELLGVSLRTVEKDWSFAKAFLLKRIQELRGS